MRVDASRQTQGWVVSTPPADTAYLTASATGTTGASCSPKPLCALWSAALIARRKVCVRHLPPFRRQAPHGLTLSGGTFDREVYLKVLGRH